MAFSKITTRGMSGDTLEAGDIAANAIGASELADNAVDTAAIADNAVTNAKIPDDLIQVKPHIKPGILQSAYRGLLLGNTTGRTFVDSGGTGHDIGSNDSTSDRAARVSHSAAKKKIGNTSIRFDGYNGDFLTIAEHDDFDRSTDGDFTWEFWINIDELQTNYTTVLGSLDSDIRITIGPDASTAPKMSVYGPWGSHLTTTTTLSLNTWYHFAYVRHSGTIRLYVNGVQEATRTSDTSDIDPNLIRIGQYYNTTLFFKGNLDEIRFSDNARYPSGTTFTPSTTAFSSDGNTKLLIHSNESLAHSGAYGTVQSDGHSYYYTDIEGCKPIKDPRIGSHFGSQRFQTTSVQRLEHETGMNGRKVSSVDGREFMKIMGNDIEKNNSYGNYIAIEDDDDPSAFLEVVGYFNDANISLYTTTNLMAQCAINGGGVGDNIGTAAIDSPLGGRYVHNGSLINTGITATLGINTLRIEPYSSAGHDTSINAVELIVHDTTSTTTRSQIQIPAQNVISYGKKFSVSASTPHYNPFAFKTDGTTAWGSGAHNGTSWPVGTGSSANIDTATSLGLENWKHGGNYYKPYNGGRVVKWIASDGSIKTSVTVMPPNAQHILGTAIAEKANASVANNTSVPTFDANGIDDSLSEVAKTFHFREFGNGSANSGNDHLWSDFSMLNGQDDNLAYVMDDGLTGMIGEDMRHNGQLYSHDSDGIYLTFIGTGFTFNSMDGVSTEGGLAPKASTWLQNLPYGTHTLRFDKYAAYGTTNEGEDLKLHIDGVVFAPRLSVTHGDNGVPYLGNPDFTFNQPKMPPIPEDACIISDYMLMADFVQNTAATTGAISKGIRRIGGSRDHFYNLASGSATAFGDGVLTHPFYWYGIGSHASNAMPVSIPYFGTSFESHAEDQSQTHTFTLDGSSVTPTEADATETRADKFYHTVSTLGQHTKVHTMPAGGYRFSATDVATPTHTSSHYKTFETRFVRELLGGDRNMEQTHLICSPDGKSWDEITRDTSYISKNLCVQTAYHAGNFTADGHISPISTQWRGQQLGQSEKHTAYVKDWAIAYNRLICLVPGTYNIKFMWYHHSGAHTLYFNQGSTHTAGHYVRSATGDETVNGDVCEYFIRGQWFALNSQNGGTVDGAGRNLITITRVE